MKTVIIILIALFFTSSVYSKSKFAKYSLGVEAGTNYNNISVSDLPYNIENNLGYIVGFNFVYSLGFLSNKSLLFNLDYLNRNHSYTNNKDNISGDITYNSLQLRNNLLFRIININSFYISAFGGPVFSYLFDSEASNESGILLENDQSFEFLLNFGLKVEKSINIGLLGLEYNYQLGLTNINTNYNRFGNNTHNLILTLKISAW